MLTGHLPFPGEHDLAAIGQAVVIHSNFCAGSGRQRKFFNDFSCARACACALGEARSGVRRDQGALAATIRVGGSDESFSAHQRPPIRDCKLPARCMAPMTEMMFAAR